MTIVGGRIFENAIKANKVTRMRLQSFTTMFLWEQAETILALETEPIITTYSIDYWTLATHSGMRLNFFSFLEQGPVYPRPASNSLNSWGWQVSVQILWLGLHVYALLHLVLSRAISTFSCYSCSSCSSSFLRFSFSSPSPSSSFSSSFSFSSSSSSSLLQSFLV